MPLPHVPYTGDAGEVVPFRPNPSISLGSPQTDAQNTSTGGGAMPVAAGMPMAQVSCYESAATPGCCSAAKTEGESPARTSWWLGCRGCTYLCIVFGVFISAPAVVVGLLLQSTYIYLQSVNEKRRRLVSLAIDTSHCNRIEALPLVERQQGGGQHHRWTGVPSRQGEM